MTIDGVFMIPKTLQLNLLTVGSHTQTVTLQDTAGSVAKYTNTFVVSTSYDDLATVVDQYANNALRTTLNGAQAIGATGLRLASPFGFRPGQTLVVDTGDNQETVTVAVTPIPPPTANTTISAAAAAGATEIRLANYTTADRRAERAHGQRADRAPADRPRHRCEPGNHLGRTSHRAASRGPGPERGPHRTADQGPCGGNRDEPRQRDAHDAADEGARNRRCRDQSSALHLGRDRNGAEGAAHAGEGCRDCRRREGRTRRAQQLQARGRQAGQAGEAGAGVKADKAEKEDKELAKTLREALRSAAKALEDELKGETLDTTGTGVTVGAGEPGDPGDPRLLEPDAVHGQSVGDVQDPRQRSGRRLPSPVDRRLRGDVPGARSRERIRRRDLGPDARHLAGPPGTCRRLAGGEPVPRSPDADAVQDDRLQLDRRSQCSGSERQPSSQTSRRSSVLEEGSSLSTAAPTRCRTSRGTWTSSVPASRITAATRAGS